MNKNLLLLSLVAPVAIAPMSKAHATEAEDAALANAKRAAEAKTQEAKTLREKADAKKAELDAKITDGQKNWKEKKSGYKNKAKTIEADRVKLDGEWKNLDTQAKTAESSATTASAAVTAAEAAIVERKSADEKKAKDAADAVAKAQAEIDAEEKTPVKVSSSDLEDADVKIKLNSGSIQLEGKLPKACADRLMIGNVKKSEDVKDIKNAKITQEKELADYTRVYELEVQFNTSKSFPSLEDCLKTQKGISPASLSAEAHSKKIKKGADLAVIKFVDEDDSSAIESDRLKELKSKLANFNCENCSQDLDSVKSTLSSSKEDVLKSAREALMDKALLELSDKIKSMDFNKLEETRKKLVELNALAEKSEQTQMIADLLHNLTIRGFEIAKSAKDQSNVRKADRAIKFAEDTYASISKLSGLSADLKEEYAARAESLKPGSFERISMLGDISPDHPEFIAKLQDSQKVQNKLLGEWMTFCSPQARALAGTFTLCANAEKTMRDNMVEFNKLQSTYSASHPQDYSFIAQGPQASAPMNGMLPSTNMMQPALNGYTVNTNQYQYLAGKPLTSGYSDFVNPYVSQGVLPQSNPGIMLR